MALLRVYGYSAMGSHSRSYRQDGSPTTGLDEARAPVRAAAPITPWRNVHGKIDSS